jgi:glutaredoxin 3
VSRVVVYATSVCLYCFAARRLLDKLAIPYEEIDVGEDHTLREEMVERARGHRTVPQIFIDGEHVGGYTELQALADAGGLSHLEPS